MIFFNN